MTGGQQVFFKIMNAEPKEQWEVLARDADNVHKYTHENEVPVLADEQAEYVRRAIAAALEKHRRAELLGEEELEELSRGLV